jgi:toxin-antitoxin system PIN domain toxin
LIALLDVNVLIALVWPNHLHHDLVLRWFRNQQRGGWATCSVTQSGFVRVSSNHRVLPAAKSPAEALSLLQELVTLPGHHFLTDDIEVATSDLVDPHRLLGYRQVTDAHLLAVALRHGARLATLDRGIRHLVPAGWDAGEVVLSLIGPEPGAFSFPPPAAPESGNPR